MRKGIVMGLILFAIALAGVVAQDEGQSEPKQKKSENLEDQGVKNFEARSAWATERFSTMKIAPPKYRPKSKLLRSFKSPDWVTEEDRKNFKKEYQKRYKNVMRNGTHYSTAVGYERYQEEERKIAKKKQAKSSEEFSWVKIILIIAASVFVVTGIALIKRK